MNASPVTIVGNLVRDPEVRTFGSGATKASFTVASEHRYMKDGEWQADPSFFNVVAWKFLAEDVERVLQKGVRVIVTGRLDQRSWEDDEGNRRSIVEINADEVAVACRSITSFDRRTAQSAQASVGGGPAAAPQAQFPDDDPWPS